MKSKSVLAWHFVGDTLRDGSPVPADGVKLKFAGEPVLCEKGYHASLDPFDALQYSPGPILCRVRCGGMIIQSTDKLVCTERTIIRRLDATDGLRYFARMQALSVIHLYPGEPANDVIDYLFGDDTAWSAARSAAWSAAESAARSAARSAAESAAWPAVRSAAWSAARSAARDMWNSLVREAFRG